MKVRTRIAPSPTGIAHVGTAWMSLFDWALAKQNNGQFVVRIEDTDRTRFVAEAEAKIYEGFEWLGIEYDEGGEKGGPFGPYHQSERAHIYQKYGEQLIASGDLYYCFCTPERLNTMREEQRAAKAVPRYDRACRHLTKTEIAEKLASGIPKVMRLKVPETGTMSWEDPLRGTVTFDLANIDDGVMIKSDGFPTYHFAVVVDDHLMEISHVLRGEEYISSMAKHLLLYKAFGWDVPIIIHMPLIRNTDKSKLSKRKNDVSILSYKEKGYLPEALVNFIALLGWSHPEKKEIFSLAEFLEVMTLDRVQTTGPIFDINKLDWMNGVYIRNLSPQELRKRLEPFLPADFPIDKYDQIIPLVFERLVTLKDIEVLTEFFYRPILPDKSLLLKKADVELVTAQIRELITNLENTPDWQATNLEHKLRSLQEQGDYKKKQYFMMVRVVVTGRQATPPLFETMETLGQETTLQRLKQALTLLAAEN